MQLSHRSALLVFAAVALAFGNTIPSQASIILSYNDLSAPSPETAYSVSRTTDHGFDVNTFSTTPVLVNLSINNGNNTYTVRQAYMTMVAVESTDTITTTVTGGGRGQGPTITNYSEPFGGGFTGANAQGYGEIEFTQFADGTGANYLTATFSTLTYKTVKGATTGSLEGDYTNATISYTSSVFQFNPLLTYQDSIVMDFSNISPASISSTREPDVLHAFTAASQGTFSATPTPPAEDIPPIPTASTPEPSTLAGAALAGSVAMLISRRRKAGTV